MKINFSALLATLMFTAFSQFVQARNCSTFPEPHTGNIFMLTLTTATAPSTSTTALICFVSGDAEVNSVMLQKEATMLAEENKIFVPSFLGTYADEKNMSIYEAAEDLLLNGIH